MRVSFRHQYDNYLSDLGRAQTALLAAQEKISTGRRINRLGDDPIGAQAGVSMRSLRSSLEQYGRNVAAGDLFLKSSESALAEMNIAARRAVELTNQAANSSLSQDARLGMVKEVEQIQKRLVELGNTQLANGTFIFAGQKSDTKPFTATGATLTYNGDQNAVLIETGPNDQFTISTPMDQLMGDAWNRLESLKSNLQSGNVSALGSVDLPALQKSSDELNLTRGHVGVKLTSLADSKTALTRRTDDLTGQISDVEDADMSEAILNYRLAETSYQAALQSVSASSRLSLMDFLR